MKWFLLVLLTLTACQPDEAELRVIEDRLKTDSTRSGRVGVVVGLGRRAQAIHVVRRLTRPVNSECVLPSGARRTTLDAVVMRGEVLTASWTETREFDGKSRLQIASSYRTELEQSNSQELAWRIDDGLFFAKDPLSESWFARPLTSYDETWLRGQGLGASQTVIDSLPGWEASAPSQWTLGVQPLNCEPDTEIQTAWLERFSGRARAIQAELTIAETRRVSAKWSLADGSIMRIEVTEEAMDWPTEEAAITALHVKSPASVDATLVSWQKRGLLEKGKN